MKERRRNNIKRRQENIKKSEITQKVNQILERNNLDRSQILEQLKKLEKDSLIKTLELKMIRCMYFSYFVFDGVSILCLN